MSTPLPILTLTTNQWAMLFMVLVLGWVLGFASRSSGRKWKRAYIEEREERSADQSRHAQEVADLNRRIVELESRPAPVIAPVVAPVAGSPFGSPAESLAAARARADDLSLIHGIGPVGEKRLNEQGLYKYADIRALDATGKAALEGRVGAPPGTIDHDRWQEQAAILEDQGVTEHRRLFP